MTLPTASAELTTVTMTAEYANVGVLRARSCSSGSSMYSWRWMNHASATTPTTMLPMTTAWPQPSVLALEKPYSRPPNANVDRMMDGTSRCGRLSSPTLESRKKLTTSTRRASGIIDQNIMRQPHASMMPPASTGPAAGAQLITMPAMPMAVPRFSGGKMSMGTTPTSGSCTPAPAACSTRPTMRSSNEGAAAHSAVPTMNETSETKNSLRVEKRSMRNPVIGTMMPLTSM